MILGLCLQAQWAFIFTKSRSEEESCLKLIFSCTHSRQRKQEAAKGQDIYMELGASREKAGVWGNLPIKELCDFPSLAGRASELTTLKETSSRNC